MKYLLRAVAQLLSDISLEQERYGGRYIIYKATNTVNGRAYIGQTKSTLRSRQYWHRRDAFTYRSDTDFHKAIREYGWDAFEWEILDSASNEEDLDGKEEAWIRRYDTFRNGYNMTHDGQGAMRYRKRWRRTRPHRVTLAPSSRPRAQGVAPPIAKRQENASPRTARVPATHQKTLRATNRVPEKSTNRESGNEVASPVVRHQTPEQSVDPNNTSLAFFGLIAIAGGLTGIGFLVEYIISSGRWIDVFLPLGFLLFTALFIRWTWCSPRFRKQGDD